MGFPRPPPPPPPPGGGQQPPPQPQGQQQQYPGQQQAQHPPQGQQPQESSHRSHFSLPPNVQQPPMNALAPPAAVQGNNNSYPQHQQQHQQQQHHYPGHQYSASAGAVVSPRNLPPPPPQQLQPPPPPAPPPVSAPTLFQAPPPLPIPDVAVQHHQPNNASDAVSVSSLATSVTTTGGGGYQSFPSSPMPQPPPQIQGYAAGPPPPPPPPVAPLVGTASTFSSSSWMQQPPPPPGAVRVAGPPRTAPPTTTAAGPPPPPPISGGYRSAASSPYPMQQQQQQQQQQAPYSYPQQQQPPHQQHRPAPQPLPRPDDRSGVDPAQIPRVPLFTRPQEQLPILFQPKAALFQGIPPPPADSRYVVVDDGNASPDLIRPCLHLLPQTRTVIPSTSSNSHGQLFSLLGLVCTPLAVAAADWCPPPVVLPPGCGDEVPAPLPPVVPLLETGIGSDPPAPPPRCSHCQAYVNAFWGTEEMGQCNFCGRRATTRELNAISPLPPFGTFEYNVTGPYVTRAQPVQGLLHLYVLDLTCRHVDQYMELLQTLGQDLADQYQRQQQQAQAPASSPPRMGLALISSAGIVLLPTERAPEDHSPYVVVPDVTQDPFCPLPLNEWTVDVSTEAGVDAWKAGLQQWQQDLGRIRDEQIKGKKTFQGQLDRYEASCGGAALAFLAQALHESGGRGTLITSKRPNYGVGRIPHREEKRTASDNQIQRTRLDYLVYTPLQLQEHFQSPDEEVAAKFYKQVGEQCLRNRVTLDILVHNPPGTRPPAFLDLATLGEVCRVTSGRLLWITEQNWYSDMYEELRRPLQTCWGWDAVFKVRCSAGVQVKSISSPVGRVEDQLMGSPELEMSSLSPSTCIGVELEHNVGGIPTSNTKLAYIQTALLYTTWSGQRRVRVSTLALATTSDAQQVFRSIDVGAVCTLLLRQAVTSLRAPLPTIEERHEVRVKTRDMVYEECISLLAGYRKLVASSHGQLLLPEKLQLLPLFCMSLLKSPMLRSGIPRRDSSQQAVTVWTPSGDERAYYNFHVGGQVGPSSIMLMVHPNVFCMNSKEEGVGDWIPSYTEGVHGLVKMPNPTPSSMECIEDDGVYLVDDGLSIFVYVGRTVASELKQELLDSESAVDSELRDRMDRMVWQLKAYTSLTRGSESELRPTVPPLVMVVQQVDHRAPMEQEVLNLMVDDSMAGEKEYVDFICTLHRRVRERVDAKS